MKNLLLGGAVLILFSASAIEAVSIMKTPDKTTYIEEVHEKNEGRHCYNMCENHK